MSHPEVYAAQQRMLRKMLDDEQLAPDVCENAMKLLPEWEQSVTALVRAAKML